jgi:hypothetical protein
MTHLVQPVKTRDRHSVNTITNFTQNRKNAKTTSRTIAQNQITYNIQYVRIKFRLGNLREALLLNYAEFRSRTLSTLIPCKIR